MANFVSSFMMASTSVVNSVLLLALCSKFQCPGVTDVRKQAATSGGASGSAQERVQGSDGVSFL